jgi:hypothetical protein
MTTWEYLTTDDAAALPQLGRERWELVAALPGVNGARPTLYLKRPAEDFRTRVTEEQKRRAYAERGRVAPEAER